ncbi:MAG TPA: pyridoxamine 5'-phosphate oxidase family protein [Verrucomicrobiae bacterium]
MNSIGENQTEEHHQDLRGQDAVGKIRELVDKAKSCFFCTAASTINSIGARPMAVQEVDDDGNVWFLSAEDSHKNEELARNPHVRLYFQGSPYTDFMILEGNATASHDKARIQDLWNPTMKTWFTEGQNDPRISIIKFEPYEGYYWDTKHGMAVAGIKMIIGAAIGKTLDDSVEGKLKV